MVRRSPCRCLANVIGPEIPSQVTSRLPSTCTIRYTVWIRLLGKPGGNMAMYSCISDPDLPGGSICSDPDWWVELTRNKGKSTFTNVSKELLFVSADVQCRFARSSTVQLFDPAL